MRSTIVAVFLTVCVLFLVLTPTPAVAQDTAGVGAIAGTVGTSDDQPLPGASVCLVGDSRCALADDDGRFRLGDVRAGGQELFVLVDGRPPVAGIRVDVRAGLDAVVDIVVPAANALEESITVTASAFELPEEISTSGFLISPSTIDASAGALQDVSRYVQSLPGVVIGANDFRNDIIVRGGSPLENLFVVDNVEIPNINAFANFTSAGGTVSLLDSDLVADVTFLTGGYPAPYGNRVSSVLQIAQREGSRDTMGGKLTLGFAGAGIVAEGPVASGRGSWIVSLRRSFLDLVTDDIGVGGVPVLYTFNGKVVFDATARDRLWMVNVSGVDRIRLGLTEDTEPDEELADFDIRYQGNRSATGFNWQRIFGTRGVGLLGVTHSRASVTSTVKDLVRDGIPPPDTPVDDQIAAGAVIFREGSTENETTLKYDLTTYAGDRVKVQAGGSTKVLRLDYDTSAPVGNDSPFTTEPGVNPFSVDSAFTTTQTGAYVQTTIQATPRLHVTGGVRVDDYRILDRTRVSPRAGASYRATDRVTVSVNYGRYYQPPLLPFVVAFPENRDLLPIQADHLVTAVSWQRDDTRLSAEAYVKRYRDYPVSSQFPSLSLANVGDTFNVRDVLFPMVSDGTGRAEGLELRVENASDGRLFGQANLSVSRTRHAALDTARRPGSYDYPIVLNIDGGVRMSSAWTLSTRLSWLAGRPYTPYDDAKSVEAGRGLFDLGRVNLARLPDYFRLDLRAERRFGSEDRPFVVFAGVQNVTNRRNVSGYTWNRRQQALQRQEQMGVFPIAGFEYTF